MDEEQVFCLKRSDIEPLFGNSLPQGSFREVGIEKMLAQYHYFLPRSMAEKDTGYKQLIPYQLLSHKDSFFVYRRGSKVGEDRLAGRFSLGIGGHINRGDSDNGRLSQQAYHIALLREQEEELTGVRAAAPIRFLGWINDDSDPVGQVHLGAVHLCEVADSTTVAIKAKDEDLHALGWWSLEEIKKKHEHFEKWSLLAVELAVLFR